MTAPVQAQPASNEADLHTFHLRNRYHADTIRHGGSQRHYHPREFAHVRPDMITLFAPIVRIMACAESRIV